MNQRKCLHQIYQYFNNQGNVMITKNKKLIITEAIPNVYSGSPANGKRTKSSDDPKSKKINLCSGVF